MKESNNKTDAIGVKEFFYTNFCLNSKKRALWKMLDQFECVAERYEEDPKSAIETVINSDYEQNPLIFKTRPAEFKQEYKPLIDSYMDLYKSNLVNDRIKLSVCELLYEMD